MTYLFRAQSTNFPALFDGAQREIGLLPLYTAPIPTIDFAIFLAVAIESNLLRVVFTREPRHFSELSADDALRRDAYTISIPTPVNDSEAPEVESVEVVQSAAVWLLAHGIDLPLAWYADVRVARRLLYRESYQVVVSTSIEAADGSGPLLANPGDRASFPGIVEARGRKRVQTPAMREDGVDLRYDMFIGTFVLDGKRDLDTQDGVEALKKRIIRRAITTPGGFSHLPEYGAGLRVKKLEAREAPKLRQSLLDQIRQEPEVAAVSVDVTFTGGVLYAMIKVRTRRRQEFAMRFEQRSQGEILVL